MPKNQSCLIWKPWITRLSPRTHAIWCAGRVLNSLQNPGACSQHFNIFPQFYTELLHHKLSFKDAHESSAESDDGMLQSLDLHDSRSAMITFLGQTACAAAGPANNASQNPFGQKWVNIFSISRESLSESTVSKSGCIDKIFAGEGLAPNQ